MILSPLRGGEPSARRRLGVLAVLSLALWAGAARGASAQQAPAGFREEILRQFDSSMGKFIALARAIPEDRYSWRPADGVMPVAQVFAHVARYNFLYPAENLGIAAPADLDLDSLERVATKAEVEALLVRSRDHVRGLRGALSEADLAQPTELYGRGVPRWAVLLQLVAHMNEHLGQSIAYARMNGIVPPWSR